MAYIRAVLMSSSFSLCGSGPPLFPPSAIYLPSLDGTIVRLRSRVGRQPCYPVLKGASCTSRYAARRHASARSCFFTLPRPISLWSRTRGTTCPAPKKLGFWVCSPLVGGAGHVLDRNASARARALYLGEVYPEFLCLLPGGIRSVGLLLTATSGGLLSLLRGALGSLLSLPCGLSRCVLGLLGSTLGSVLNLACRLSCCVLNTLGGLSGLPERSSDGARHLVSYLPHGVLRSSALLIPAGELLGGLPDGLGDLLDGFSKVGDLQVQDVAVGSDL